MVAEVFHPVDVDSYIWGPVETLYQSPSSIVHTHPSNDLQKTWNQLGPAIKQYGLNSLLLTLCRYR